MRVIVTGTDTDVGKTVVAAALAGALGATYWKPVQSGLIDGTDSNTVLALAGDSVRILPEVYRLQAPLSPNIAAAREGVGIDRNALTLPAVDGPLVVEGAGGVLVPLADDWLSADQFAAWGLPVILVARTTLGTINHTLLSVEALRARGVEVMGVFFNGEENRETEECICTIGKVAHLGRLGRVEPLNAATLAAAFAVTALGQMAR